MVEDLSLVMLSYRSPRTLINTLTTYKDNGLLDLCGGLTVFFQAISPKDIEIADQFNLRHAGWPINMRPFDYRIKEIIDTVQTEYFIFLENDWCMAEDKMEMKKQISEAMELLDSGKADVIKLRHRKKPGVPLYSERLLKFKEKEVWDKWSSHLMECVHWYDDPDLLFPEQIKKEGDYYYTTSEFINYTNNPCLYKTELFKSKLSPFFLRGQNIELRIEGGYWKGLKLKVAHGKGLFTHIRLDR